MEEGFSEGGDGVLEEEDECADFGYFLEGGHASILTEVGVRNILGFLYLFYIYEFEFSPRCGRKLSEKSPDPELDHPV